MDEGVDDLKDAVVHSSYGHVGIKQIKVLGLEADGCERIGCVCLLENIMPLV